MLINQNCIAIHILSSHNTQQKKIQKHEVIVKYPIKTILKAKLESFQKNACGPEKDRVF